MIVSAVHARPYKHVRPQAKLAFLLVGFLVMSHSCPASAVKKAILSEQTTVCATKRTVLCVTWVLLDLTQIDHTSSCNTFFAVCDPFRKCRTGRH